MLQTASRTGLTHAEKETFLRTAVAYLANALESRSINENIDLHYICMIQMSQMLIATRRYQGAMKVFVKLLLCLSITLVRSAYCTARNSLPEELKKQVLVRFYLPSPLLLSPPLFSSSPLLSPPLPTTALLSSPPLHSSLRSFFNIYHF